MISTILVWRNLIFPPDVEGLQNGQCPRGLLRAARPVTSVAHLRTLG